MDCKQAEQLIIDYVYGELQAPQQAQFESHLHTCRTCSQEVADLQGVLHLVRKYQADAPAANVDQKILAAASEVFTIPKRPWWQMVVLRPILIPAALVFIISAVGLFFYSQQPEKTTEPVPESIDSFSYQPPGPEQKNAISVVETALEDTELAFGVKDEEQPSTQAAGQAPGKTNQAKRHKAVAVRKPRSTRSKKISAAPQKKPRRKPKTRSLAERPQTSQEAQARSIQVMDKTKSGRGFVEARPQSAAIPKQLKGSRKKTKRKQQALTSAPAQQSMSQPEVKLENVRPKPQAPYEAKSLSADTMPARMDLESKETEKDLMFSGSGKANPFQKAKNLFQAGKCPEAIKEYTAAFQANPKHPQAAEALFDQASCHTKLGQYQQAIDIYKKIMRLYPKQAQRAKREIQRLSR